MCADVTFRLLGPFEIEADTPVLISRKRERCLLAVLLLEQGSLVAPERLADLLWDGEPPFAARSMLRSHISRVRAAVGSNTVRITTQRGGYRLDTDPQTIDAHRFRSLVGQARDLPEPERRSGLLRLALDLWRGPVLADLATTPLTQRLGAELEELRLETLDQRIAADLAIGRHREIIGELRELVAAAPSHESFTAHLILALYRSARQRDALAVYEDCRQLLATEFGLCPGPILRRLQERILRADPTLDLPERIEVTAQPNRLRQLPHDSASFTGREPELARLHTLAAAGGSAPTIIAIDGAPGTGKTTLALRFAHRVAERYPDVQLYLNLRGHDPGEPLTPAAATEALLRLLGVDGRLIPPGLAERSALLRGTLAGREALVLLDNARDCDQVRALLPGTGCLVIVTSRNKLPGLSIRDGAQVVTLHGMPRADAVALLAAAVGADRIKDEPAEADRLVELCDHLPLALAIVAEHARRAGTLAEVVCALRGEKARLDQLSAGTDDPHIDLRAAFSWSYRALRPDASAMFRRLGLHPANDIGPQVAAALAGLPVPAAQSALDALVAAHLVEQRSRDRYELHDLIRLYATEMSAHEAPAERQAAVRRMLDWYLHAAVSADTTLLRHRRRDFVAPFEPTVPRPEFATRQEAAQWFEQEYESLCAVTVWALANGWAGHGWRIALAMMTLFDQTIPACDGVAFYARTARDASAAGDVLGEAYALNSLASLHMATPAFEEAMAPAERALALFRQCAHPWGEAMVLCNIGLLHGEIGRYEESRRYIAAALEMCERLDYPRGTAINLANLGIVLTVAGEYERAVEQHEQALALARQLGDAALEATNQHHLGRAHVGLGDIPGAIRAFRTAVSIYRRIGSKTWEAVVLTDLAQLGRGSSAEVPGLSGAGREQGGDDGRGGQ